jgi:hypothetical protein
MPGSFDERGQLDPAAGRVVTCLGKKGSGKSVMALMLFREYPYDRVVIDVAGDDGPMPAPGDQDVVELSGSVDELPARWPEHLRHDERRMTIRYVPDPGSPTYLEDMDHLVGLAMAHGRCALLVHEMGVLAPSGKVQPHTARFLRFGRHRKVTGFFCAPRTLTMDPLVLGQSDVLFVFELQTRPDRERIAGTIGWDIRDFDADVLALGQHEFLIYDANAPKPEPGQEDVRLLSCPALPQDDVRDVLRWSRGQGRPDPTGATP